MNTHTPGADRTVSRTIEAAMLVARNQQRTHDSREVMRLAMTLHDRGRLDAAAVLVAATTLIDGTADFTEVLDIITKTDFTIEVDDL